MLSGPGALFVLMVLRSFSTPLVSIVMDVRLESIHVLTLGKGPDWARVKTELNWLSNNSALDLLSLSSCPLCLRGDTPILSCFLDLT